MKLGRINTIQCMNSEGSMHSKNLDEVVGGIDIGSSTTKVVLLDLDKNIRACSIVPTGALVKDAITICTNQCLSKVGLKEKNVKYWVSSGYGRELITFPDSHQVTEITCHAKGVNMIYPEARTVIDVGGQDSKVISINQSGNVNSFIMNDKCAAGTGKFLEVMANVLNIKLSEMSNLVNDSRKNLNISSICTVFAESEIIGLLSKGNTKSDIIVGVYKSIVRRLSGFIHQVGLIEPVVMSGGGARNLGLVKALEKHLKVSIAVPENPQIVGALGAAYFALHSYNKI